MIPLLKALNVMNTCFFENGSLAATVLYTGNHPLAGELHFVLNGKDYLIGKENETA